MILLLPAALAGLAALVATQAPAPLAIGRAAWGLGLAFAASVALALAAALGMIAAPGLALALLVLTSFVATIVLAFSRRYLRADRAPRRFAAMVAALAASVLAVVVLDNVIAFALAWLASGQLLARLIGHVDGWAEARAAAGRARRAFLIGDAALLTALALAAAHAGSLSLAVIVSAETSFEPEVLIAIAALVLIAAMARSALPPFEGWLIGSMTAPTPVSALMHAGLVNAGGFVLIRFAPVLEAAPVVQLAAIAAGTLAALWGTGIALVRPDIKRALAGSTVAQMGFMILSCGLGAYGAALWHLIAHGLFKAWLFLASGSAIGAMSAPALRKPDATVAGAVAVLVLGLGGLMLWAGGTSATLLPLMLATATGVMTLVAASAAQTPRWPQLIGLGALLAAGHAAGLWLIERAVQQIGVAPVTGPWVLLLVLPFLALWIWQARRLSLPAPLYVRLLNAGLAA
ncbi:MAG: hypothetical protein A4S12_13605 [Proteobacteria bacterium SG_bin5]|nr:hypothetical protein [Sphingomonas sp.]OQW44230.1 MAG: hypothetical protein A4S12_13605 [Proteobacteria bacterium SG_bin5]